MRLTAHISHKKADIKKAFDSVDHEILLRKLEICSFDSPAVKWFRSYVCNRRQVCVVGDAVSNEGPLTGSVPPGSIIGPLLCLIDINDSNNISHYAKCKMYVDDTSLCMRAWERCCRDRTEG